MLRAHFYWPARWQWQLHNHHNRIWVCTQFSWLGSEYKNRNRNCVSCLVFLRPRTGIVSWCSCTSCENARETEKYCTKDNFSCALPCHAMPHYAIWLIFSPKGKFLSSIMSSDLNSFERMRAMRPNESKMKAKNGRSHFWLDRNQKGEGERKREQLDLDFRVLFKYRTESHLFVAVCDNFLFSYEIDINIGERHAIHCNT